MSTFPDAPLSKRLSGELRVKDVARAVNKGNPA